MAILWPCSATCIPASSSSLLHAFAYITLCTLTYPLCLEWFEHSSGRLLVAQKPERWHRT